VDYITQFEGNTAWITPALLLLGFLGLGLVFEKILLRRLRAAVQRTGWQAGGLVISAVTGVTVLWFFLIGVYMAVQSLMLRPDLEGFVFRALQVLWILSLTLVAARIAAGMVALYASRSEGLIPSATIFRNLTAALVFGLGALVLLQSLGVPITPMLTALGVGGLAVALALQDTLSNLFAGLHIIATKQVQVGDFVRLESGEEGFVMDIHWRNTTVRALANHMFIIPNSRMAGAIITNFYQPDKETAVLVPVGVSYASDLEHVERVTIEVAREALREIPGAVAEFPAFIRYNAFADSSINFNVILRAKEVVDQHMIRHEFIKRLHKRYAQEGIEIPFPIRTVHFKDMGKESS
jgi:small-conductance mechanosensitive channel